MKNMKKLMAALLALVMVLGLAACQPGGSTPSDTPDASGGPETSAPVANTGDLEELGSGDVKWKEETTSDGWVKSPTRAVRPWATPRSPACSCSSPAASPSRT